MADKINGVSSTLIQSANAKPATADKISNARSPAAGAANTESTTVNITRDAKLLGELDHALASASDVDAGKVDSIKAAIANGEFEIDADKVAAALLKFDRDSGIE